MLLLGRGQATISRLPITKNQGQFIVGQRLFDGCLDVEQDRIIAKVDSMIKFSLGFY